MKLIVVSSYPEKGLTHPTKTVGGAYYTKGVLSALKKSHKELDITVYGEYFDKKEQYRENGISVNRLWKRNNPFSLWSVFFALLTSPTDKLLISFEVNMYGNWLMSLTICLQLLLLKLLGKKPTLVIQHVLEGFGALEKNLFKRSFLDTARIAFYRLLLLGAHKVIVFEEQFKEVIKHSHSDITVIPLFVPKAYKGDRTTASKAIGISPNTFHVLFFGFLSPYKGVDWLIDNWPAIPNTSLIVAGGPNPNHTKNVSYMNFVKRIKEEVNKKRHEFHNCHCGEEIPRCHCDPEFIEGEAISEIATSASGVTRDDRECQTCKRIELTGFVQEKDMPAYFNAADVLILPYKTFFSSSGPLSLAYAYEKGFVFSKPLRKYALSADFKESLQESNISLDDLSFDFDAKDLRKTILWSKQNIQKLSAFSKKMKQKRDVERVADRLYECIIN